jgi:glycosyltransferase involved in cell wall biosynthesis
MSERALALIPAYNEAGRIASVIRQAREQVAEVLVIDDGSPDQTSLVARDAGATVIRHEQNGGKGASIITALACFAKSQADYGILLDADGQHDPAEIPKFIATARETGAGIVVGSRMQDTKEMPFVRLMTNRFTSWVTSKLARQRIPDSQCGFKPAVPATKSSVCRFVRFTSPAASAGFGL